MDVEVQVKTSCGGPGGLLLAPSRRTSRVLCAKARMLADWSVHQQSVAAETAHCRGVSRRPGNLRLVMSPSLLTCMVVCFDQFSRKGALMNTRWAVGLCAIALVTIPVFPNSSAAQGTSLKDQLVGTWIYVSSTAKRDDGSNVPRPSLQGAVTYTGDGRFHFIVTRTDAPRYASGDLARPSPDEAMAIASGGSIAYTG